MKYHILSPAITVSCEVGLQKVQTNCEALCRKGPVKPIGHVFAGN